jgi:hypothetical protein
VPEWSGEVVVDAALARRLIGGQFPDFAGAPLALLPEGWDLPLYWCLLTPAARADFRAAYPVTDEQLLRGRVLALFLCALLALYARAEGFAALEAEALAGIRRSS